MRRTRHARPAVVGRRVAGRRAWPRGPPGRPPAPARIPAVGRARWARPGASRHEPAPLRRLAAARAGLHAGVGASRAGASQPGAKYPGAGTGARPDRAGHRRPAAPGRAGFPACAGLPGGAARQGVARLARHPAAGGRRPGRRAGAGRRAWRRPRARRAHRSGRRRRLSPARHAGNRRCVGSGAVHACTDTRALCRDAGRRPDGGTARAAFPPGQGAGGGAVRACLSARGPGAPRRQRGPGGACRLQAPARVLGLDAQAWHRCPALSRGRGPTKRLRPGTPPTRLERAFPVPRAGNCQGSKITASDHQG